MKIRINNLKKLTIGLLFGGMTLSCFALSVTRAPYLQESGTDRMRIRWKTDNNSNSVVRYGTSQSNLNKTKTVSGSRKNHKVDITGLSPNTKYYYSIGSSSQTLRSGSSYFFRTNPSNGSAKTRIWVVGDSGTGDSNQRRVRDAFYNYADNTKQANLFIVLGDNAYNSTGHPEGSEDAYQKALFSEYNKILRNTFIMPTIGNHDTQNFSPQSSAPYFSMFSIPTNGESGGVPSGTEAYYSVDYANIHFVCLDSQGPNPMNSSYYSTSGAMANWLKDDLAANTKEWLIVFFHHPPYTKGSHNSDNDTDSGGRLKLMRENILPILENNGVDLVLCGHSHSYERSYLIDGHYGKSSTFTNSMKKDGGDGKVSGDGPYQKVKGPRNGAVYTVAGSSGKATGNGSMNHPAMYIGLSTSSNTPGGADSLNEVLGSVIIDVDGKKLDLRFLDANGNVTDSCRIEHTSSPSSSSSSSGSVRRFHTKNAHRRFVTTGN